MHLLSFCGKFNSEQLLFEAFFDIPNSHCLPSKAIFEGLSFIHDNIQFVYLQFLISISSVGVYSRNFGLLQE